MGIYAAPRVLGDKKPKVLLDTLVFYNVYILRFVEGSIGRSTQLQLVENSGSTPYPVLTGSVSMANQRGLLHQKKSRLYIMQMFCFQSVVWYAYISCTVRNVLKIVHSIYDLRSVVF